MAAKERPKCDVDPVCNMNLEEMHGKYMYDFEDEVYYFCSELCKEKFKAEPEKFVRTERT